MAKVFVTASQTPRGRKLQEFASDLATKLGMELEKVHPTELMVRPMDPGSILVHRERIRTDVTMLLPLYEKTLLARGVGPVLVPFGSNIETATLTAAMALPICRKLGLPVVFYHTTWEADGEKSELTWDHMSLNARQVAVRLQTMAEERRVTYRFCLDRSDTISGGVTEAAHRFGCSLICLGESLRTRQGSSSTNVLRLTSTPTVVLGRDEARSMVDVGNMDFSKPDVRTVPQWAVEGSNRVPLGQYAVRGLWSRFVGFLNTAYGAMSIIVVFNVVKVIAQYVVGAYIVSSAMLVGNAWHNTGDVVEGLSIMVVMFLGYLAHTLLMRRFPFGLKKLEEVAMLVIGVGLCYVATKFLLGSIYGLWAWVPGQEEWLSHTWLASWQFSGLPTIDEHIGLVCAVVLGSAVCSVIVGRHQIAVGRRQKRQILIADGKETISDSIVEFGMLAGVLLVYFSGQPRAEYIASGVIALKLLHTGIYELAWKSGQSLLGGAIERELEDGIRQVVMSFRGIDRVAELKTFRIGADAYVILKLETSWGIRVAAQTRIKRVLEEQIAEFLEEHETGVEKINVRFDPSNGDSLRVIIPLCEPARNADDCSVCGSLEEATYFCKVDFAGGKVDKAEDDSLAEAGAADVRTYLSRKHVRQVWTSGYSPTDAALCRELGIEYVQVDSSDIGLFVPAVE